MAQTHLPPNWQDRVVVGINGTPNGETRRFLMAQQQAEGGTAKWNPCNNTLWVQNFTDLPDYNDAKVRNYSFPNVGVAAHVLTLTSHRPDGTLVYGRLVNELQNASASGHTAEQIVANAKADIQTWGTNPDLMLQILASL